MKSIERHKLKENEFAKTMARTKAVIDTRGPDMVRIAIAALVIVALVGGYTWWRQSRNGRATALLAEALAVSEAPVIAPVAPAPGSPAPVQQSGTFQTEAAKLEAALPKFMAAADTYPGTDAGIAARYHAASILAELGRLTEAEQRYQEVADKAGSRIYRRTARLGMADVQVAQGKFDPAIKTYQELSTDSSSQLPLDGVLMQLGRAYMKAGKKAEAARAFTRVVDEFPLSVYAADARREMEEAKKS